MSISTSGMNAARNQLNVASQNLANSETFGYKSFRAILGDVYGQTQGSSVEMAGVTTIASQQQFSQGQLMQTGNSFDMGIDGSGFFILNADGSQLYSRAGTFQQDNNYYLVNPSGFRLQGYGVNNLGTVDTSRLVDLQISQADRPGIATTSASAAINLDATDSVINRADLPLNPTNSATYSYFGALNIFDSLGGQHTLNTYFTKTGTNEWLLEFQIDGQSLTQTEQLTFTTSGALTTPTSAQFTLTPPALTNGATLQNIAVNFSGVTQFSVDSSFNPLVVNGQTAGSLNQVTVGNNGLLEGIYSNGEQYVLGQVALAIFPADNGLQVNGLNTWSSSMASGSPVYSVSGSNGAGMINAGFLEQSNVELANALSDVILAQRFFQVNAKAFQAEDVLSQTLINLS